MRRQTEIGPTSWKRPKWGRYDVPMKKIFLAGIMLTVLLLVMGCSPISKEQAINKAYFLIQSTCDTNSNAVRAPKSAYKADKPNDTWLITIEGAFSSRFAVGIVTIEDDPDFGKPHFTASFEMLDYDCGRGWRSL